MKQIGYKMVQKDGLSFYGDAKIAYSVGATIEQEGTKDGQLCGVGLHLGKQRHDPLRYNARLPCRLFECEYDSKDIRGEDDNKVRVSKLRVVKELDCFDLGLPHCDQLKDRFERLQRYDGMKAQTPQRKKNIEKCLARYVKLLSKADKEHRVIELKGVKFHGIKEWDSVRGSVRDSVWGSVRGSVRGSVWGSVRGSVRDSVWGSVRDSVRDSVWGSVWDSVVYDDLDSPFLLELEVLEYGAVLYGIDKKGIAHVIMPTAKEG
jgi:hypothetical protein